MTRARLGYDFIALPRRRHPGWVGLRNSYGPLLFAPLFEIAEGAPIPFHGSDWRVWLCRVWCLSGKARSPVCKALDELAERGVIAVGDGSLSVLFRPEDRHNSSTQKLKEGTTRAHSGSEPEHVGPIPGRHLGLSVENDSTLKTQTDRQNREKEERDRARERASDFRRPVGEPPPGFADTFREPDPEPTLEEQILTAWKRAVFEKTTRTPASSKAAAAGASEVASWLRENVRDNETPLSAFQVALKQYLADEKKNLADASWPLKWLTERLPGYLAAKKDPPRPQAHQLWVDPTEEWQRNFDRVEREHRERLERDPEYRASVEALEPPTARRVVSITSAPTPKPLRPSKTPEELEQRRQLLQEQARQLMAASDKQ